MQAARDAPEIGSLGWVYTRPEHRGKGISSCLTAVALQWFNEIGGVCAHLGTSNLIANHVYAKRGFFDYHHKTMRYLRPGLEHEKYDETLFANVGPATIRLASWCDASRIACLYASRHPWFIKDYQEGLFCSKSITQRRYFSVPCSILGRAELNEGAVYVMETSDRRIVGSANINRVDDNAQAHVAHVEFLVHPTHFGQTGELLAIALQRATDRGARIARISAASSDEQRIEAAEAAGFHCTTVHADQFIAENQNLALCVYSRNL